MREVNEAEVEVEVATEDKLDAAIMDKVQISSTTVMRKEKSYQENIEEAIQAQGMINLKPNAITVKRLATLPIIELRRRLTMWSKKMRSLKQCS